ncbi:hypothetical protein PsorP6_007612 [Peronosclerospora sorghi]|uniref:Uncharacterized protein n=1 Tax=Peronosclerospora sorghi TaxID=230839 RepID=A0ACC0WCZ0_9STRA|nr:hypothetical protein PsorP6_007612 [Peronosclerospora sorghi]
MDAKYVLDKCKDKGRVENEDLGHLLLSLEDMSTSGEERMDLRSYNAFLLSRVRIEYQRLLLRFSSELTTQY